MERRVKNDRLHREGFYIIYPISSNPLELCSLTQSFAAALEASAMCMADFHPLLTKFKFGTRNFA